MNKKSIFYAIVILFISNIQSQNFLEHINIATGVNLMNINLKGTTTFNEELPNDDALNFNVLNKATNASDDPSSSSETGFYIGFIYDNISINKKLNIQPEIRFVGVKDFNQLQIPLLLKYEVLEKLILQSGPNLGFSLDVPEGLKSFNFALDFGVSYNVVTNLLVEARYNWGQTNLLDQDDNDNYLKLNSFQIGLVYKLKTKN